MKIKVKNDVKVWSITDQRSILTIEVPDEDFEKFVKYVIEQFNKRKK